MYYGLGLLPFSESFEFLSTKLEQLRESGILNYLISKSIKKEVSSDDTGPQVLTLMDLKAGFMTWLLMHGISSLMFLIEFLLRKLKLKVGEHMNNTQILPVIMNVSNECNFRFHSFFDVCNRKMLKKHFSNKYSINPIS